MFSRRLLLSIAFAISTIVVGARASAADAGSDSGIADSGVSTVPSEGGKLVDATTSTSSSGDPAPTTKEDDGGCAVSGASPGGGDGWAALGVLATASIGMISRARRRRRSAVSPNFAG